MFGFFIITLCFFPAIIVKASDFYFSEMPSSIPGNLTLWNYNTVTQQTVKLGEYYETVSTAYDIVSGAAVCDNFYYTSAVDVMITWGLMKTNLQTKEITVFNNYQFDNLIIHNLWCNNKEDNSLYAIESTTSDPVFALYKITIDNDQITNEKIGTFDMSEGKNGAYFGSDAMFQANADVSEVWATWSNKNQNGGFIQVMEVKTGVVTTYDLKGTTPAPGYPYTVVPLEYGQNPVLGILNHVQLQPHTRTASFTLDKDRLTANIGDVGDGTDDYTGFTPWAIEYDAKIVHSIVINQKLNTIRTFDALSGELLSEIEMNEILGTSKDGHSTGGLAVRNDNGKDAATMKQPHYRTYGSTCTGDHEFCCEAPNNDPKNCPPSAYTMDCAKINSCCCA